MLKLNVRQGAKTMSNPNLNTSHVKVKPKSFLAKKLELVI